MLMYIYLIIYLYRTVVFSGKRFHNITLRSFNCIRCRVHPKTNPKIIRNRQPDTLQKSSPKHMDMDISEYIFTVMQFHIKSNILTHS